MIIVPLILLFALISYISIHVSITCIANDFGALGFE